MDFKNKFKKGSYSKIRLSYEYGAYPIWLLDEKGSIYDNDLPEELVNNKQINDKLMQLQKRFDVNFIDNSTIFEAQGFDSADEKNKFINDSNHVFEELKSLVGEKYEFEQSHWLKLV